jgi:hypothetical protein
LFRSQETPEEAAAFTENQAVGPVSFLSPGTLKGAGQAATEAPTILAKKKRKRPQKRKAGAYASASQPEPIRHLDK